MAYNNNYSLELIGTENVEVPFCETCNEFKTGKFCSNCGTPLTRKETSLDDDEIIDELRNKSEIVNYALEENCSGYQVEEDIQKFSEKYPMIIFQLDVIWDSGFGDPPSRYFFKNGVKQDATPKVSFDEPNF